MQLSFTPLPDLYAIVRLPAASLTPAWVKGPGLINVTMAEDEVSIVCPSDRVPPSVKAEQGYATLRVDTLAALDEPGVVMAAVAPIAAAGLGVFVISTHLRDYLLVRHATLPKVRSLLTEAGHVVV
ncbi:ACT domain-containing protein [Pseudooctadecabacter sp.]|uniref:ACT domain-containing protein n=1 Tax=Pseudooctadecabacter sp. TaxID=1966338 RepID=UPI0025EB4F90|nr:ACT domain-containing protein [Pseudooctadecabacter sp.]